MNFFTTTTINKKETTKNILALLGTGIVAIASLHLINEVFIRTRSLFFENPKTLGYEASSYFYGSTTTTTTKKKNIPSPKALITGGANGVGLEFGRQLFLLGCQVEIWDIESQNSENDDDPRRITRPFQKQQEEEKIKGPLFSAILKFISTPSDFVENEIIYKIVDVSNPRQIEDACDDFLQRNNNQGPDLLCLNAATFTRKCVGEFTDSEREIEKVFATNCTVHCFGILNKFLPKMLLCESSPLVNWRRSIVLISSVTGFSGFAFAADYAASKAALISLGDSLRAEIRLKSFFQSQQHQQQNDDKKTAMCVDCDVMTVCPYLIKTRLFSFCEDRIPTWFKYFVTSSLSPEYVVSSILNGIRLRRSCLVLPFLFNAMPIVRWLFPEFVFVLADKLMNGSAWLKR